MTSDDGGRKSVQVAAGQCPDLVNSILSKHWGPGKGQH